MRLQVVEDATPEGGAKARLFAVMDGICVKIKQMEKVIVGSCGRWEFTGTKFFIARNAGAWRIMAKLDDAQRPVADCSTDVRIAFAKVARKFLEAYVDWKMTKLADMELEARHALEDMP